MPKITSFIQEEVISHAEHIISEYSCENNEEAMNSLYRDVDRFLSSCFSDKTLLNFDITHGFNGDNDSILIWQNQDSYYCRLTDHLNNMFFEVEDYRLEFRLQSVQPEEGGKNKPKRYFFLAAGSDPVVIQRKKRILSVNFEYRRLTEEEKGNLPPDPQKRLITETVNKIFSTLDITKDKKLLAKLKSPSENLKTDTLTSNILQYTSDRDAELHIFPNIDARLKMKLEQFLLQEYSLFNQTIMRKNVCTPEKILKQMLGIQELCKEIIDFVAKIAKIFQNFYEKKPFVVKNGYCISLGLVSPDLYPKVKEIPQQLSDWDTILRLDCQFDGDIFQQFYVSRGEFLPVNSTYFSSEEKILFYQNHPTIESEVGGLAIKSENWRAMNFLLPTYVEKMKMIYIDPPYNTGTDDMVYNDKFHRSNWLSFMDNRLAIAKQFLTPQGIFFSSIDDNELAVYSLLIENHFLKRLNNIVWHKKTQPSYLSKELIPVTEYIMVAKNTPETIPLMGSFGDQNKLTEMINIGNTVCERVLPKTRLLVANGWTGILESGVYGKDKLQVELLNGSIKVTAGVPEKDLQLRSRFKWLQERIDSEVKKGGLIHIKSTKSLRPTIARHYDEPIVRAPTTLLSKKINEFPTNTDANQELKALFGVPPFDYSKPVNLVKFLVQAATYYGENGNSDGSPVCIFDFFGGSGTTAQAVIEQNASDGGKRKYLLVEKEDYFDSVLLPRLQKVMYSQEWHDGKPIGPYGYKHILKYMALEQFEDCFYNLQNPDTHANEDPWLLTYEMKFGKGTPEIKLSVEHFNDPFRYILLISDNGVLKYEQVDLIETFNYLIGLSVERMEVKKNSDDKDRIYWIVHGTTSSQKVLIIWRALLGMDESLDADFIQSSIISHYSFDALYKNGDNLEKEFCRRMFDSC
jgi:adenine-specific DNA-methyltransferase